MKHLFLIFILVLSLSPSLKADVEEKIQPTEDYYLFVTIKIKPGKVVDFKRALLPYLEKTHKESGINIYKVHQSADESTRFEYYLHFASKEAHLAHLDQPHTKDYLVAAKPLFEDGYPDRRKVFELK